MLHNGAILHCMFSLSCPIWLDICDKEHLALRNNFRVTKKFLIGKFDSIRCILNVSYFFPGAEAQDVFELPPEMANPQKTPCVNVPEWFVKEGGELCLSDTKNGLSIIRYWPKFLSERGNALMFKRLRKYCKWHQKQVSKF